ncbi:PP2C family protein-serine/threonine phosphatase [Ottowia thiooxydans]|uniref:Sigma-B regulation protein RsbU (Phosphoserine phosphatase) n=1 Tax=Ottowia thiooxydans TaxID=219182 RepID=A0ABV2Q547_9BURK
MTSLEQSPGRVLVVDDNEANRDLLVRRLQRQGHATETAADGQQALDMMRASAFDLVLLDIMMPVLNGYEVLKQIRADAGLRHVPVVLISALGDGESIVKGIELGADDYLPKPFNPHILRARVDASLAKKRLHDREQMHARSLERELEIARKIQAGFLPEALPEAPGWELAAWFQPARQVSGDFYDAFPVLGDTRTALVVADVCGKGVGAALFMALFRSLFRVLAERLLTPAGDGAAQVCELVSGVNDYIARTHDRANMFATVFVAILDPATGGLVYVNGGHEAPILAGLHGVRERLTPTGPAVGMMQGLPFLPGHAVIAPGESLIAFTDGVTDAICTDGTRFSEARLLDLLAQPAQSADRTVASIRAELQVSTHHEPFDDVTLLVAQRQRA